MKIFGAKPFFSEKDVTDISAEIKETLRSGRLILGQNTKKFEETFKEYIGTKYAVALSSCTAALECVLRYFDVKGFEVIVPTNTFIATPNAVVYAGGKPIFADIRSDTLCIDPVDILRKITNKTKGIIVVHIAGLVCPEMDEIKEICDTYNLFLIEDVAHAHGATVEGKKAGSLGDAGCFSFYPTKVMTTCTGGMITTNDKNLAEFALSLRHHGQGKDLSNIINFGNDWIMDEISSILGIYQLKRLEENIKKRNEIAKKYTERIKGIEGISLFEVPPGIRHSYYKYPILLKTKKDRDNLKNLMERKHIEVGSLYYPPCHLQPIYKKMGWRKGMLPVAENTLARQITLPMHPQLTDKEIDYVTRILKQFANKRSEIK